MWDSLWLDVNLATMMPDEGIGDIADGAIAVTDDKISWVGKRAELPAEPSDLAKVIHKLNYQWLTPGLIDCHTHLVYAGNRAQEFNLRMQGMSYADIARQGGGIQTTVAATRKASVDELFNTAARRLSALMREGVTTVEIKSGYGLDESTEIKMLRVARKLAEAFPVTIKTTFLGAHALPSEYKNRADEYINFICEQVLPAVVAEKLADAVDVFCESIGFSQAQAEQVFKAAQRYKLPVKMHAEQLTNSQGALLAAKYNALSADHLEYADQQSIMAMAQHGTVAVLLPGAFYFLQEKQQPPIDLLREYKVPIAIATDANPGSSPTTSLLLMLNMACVLLGLTPTEALRGITINAAKALGIGETVGSLEVGKMADFAVWGVDHPLDLAYGYGFNPCVGIVKAGKSLGNR